MAFPIFIEKALGYVLPYAGLAFQATNESIPAIMEGLQIQQGDRVLAVCGSGDQAFAMLELADYVTAVDSSKLQILYARCRLAQIKRGDFKRFYTLLSHCGSSAAYREQRSRYFTLSKLQTLKWKVDRLRLEREDMYKFSPRRIMEGRFNKIYLSNLLCHSAGFSEYFIPDKDIPSPKVLSMVLCSLHAGGLVYVSRRGVFELDIGAEIPLALQRNLTAVATSYEAMGAHDFWDPAVFRKTY